MYYDVYVMKDNEVNINGLRWDRKDCILMQYTGSKDKNGKDFYLYDIGEFENGDRFIIECEEWIEFYAKWIGEPECEDQARDFYRIRSAKIIGNKFENPELLRGTE
jgi:hypothetical protein